MKQSVIFLGPDISDSLRLLAYRVAEQTGLKCNESENPGPEQHDLVWDESKQVFALKLAPAQPSLTLDLLKQSRYFLAQSSRSKKTPLVRALGKKAFQGGLVWDASGGSGRDLCHLLSLGVERLWVFERHPVVYALLVFETYQLKRYLDSKIELEVFYADASNFQTEEIADVVFYDPMYPEKKKKSSLSRKAMEVFKDLVGPDLDEVNCLKKLVQSPHKRVVLKRPLKAKALISGVSTEFKGSTTRYDLYV
jgi:16S rRNA (guanine1516-N2)-methyltransferase